MRGEVVLGADRPGWPFDKARLQLRYGAWLRRQRRVTESRAPCERLYLSHRTVASHLYRLFPKLGISSRNELHRAMGSYPA